MEAFHHQDSFLSPGVAPSSKIVAVYPKCYHLVFTVPNPSKDMNLRLILASLLLLVSRILQDFHATCFSGASHRPCHPGSLNSSFCHSSRKQACSKPPQVPPTLPLPPDNPLGQPCQGMCQLIGNVFRQVLHSSAKGDKDKAVFVSAVHPRLEILWKTKFTLNTTEEKHRNREQTWLRKSSCWHLCCFRSQVLQIPNILYITENNGSRFRIQGRGHEHQNPSVFVLASVLTTSGLKQFVPP